MSMTTFKAEQAKELTPAERALEDAHNGSVSAMQLAAMVGAFLTETDDTGRNTLWSEQGMILKGIADVAYRKLHTQRTWINRNNQEVALGVQAQYAEAKERTNAADKLDDGTEIAGKNVDEALAYELERKHAKITLEAFISAFGQMYEAVSGREYIPWMPQETNARAETSAKKATKQDREARKAKLAQARK
jgi:hypothetical protein